MLAEYVAIVVIVDIAAFAESAASAELVAFVVSVDIVALTSMEAYHVGFHHCRNPSSYAKG